MRGLQAGNHQGAAGDAWGRKGFRGLCPPGFEDSDMAVIEAGTDLTTMHETDPRKSWVWLPAGARNVASSIAAPGGLDQIRAGSDRVEIAVQGLGVPMASHFENFSPTI